MFKKKLAKVLCTSLLVSTIVGTSAFAADRHDYSAYKLPAFQGNNYGGTHTKENSKNYITNEVTAMTDASTVTFWAANVDHEQISKDYDQKVGNRSEFVFTVAGYDKKGAQVCMGMENADVTWKTGFVSGWVNFH